MAGMLIHELLPLVGDGVREVVDVTPEPARVGRRLRAPEGVRRQVLGLDEAAELEPGPDHVVVALLGPDPEVHSDPGALAPVLGRLRPGAHAVLLLAWPIAELPYHLLLEPLVNGSCQVIEAVGLQRVDGQGPHCALVVRCVDAVTAPRAYLMDIRPERPAPVDPGRDERRVMLRVANEYVLADFVARPMRQRLIELERQVRDLDQVLASRYADLSKAGRQVTQLRTQLAKARAQAAALKDSVSFQLGRVIADGARRPGRSLLTAPRDLTRVWRARHSRQSQQPEATAGPADGPPPDRVVHLALPALGPIGAGRELLTMTAPPRLLVPRKLAQAGVSRYEPDALACFLAAIEMAGPGAVLDIGANVGIYAALASALSARDVVAFEPTPELAGLAQRLADDNGLGYAVETLALGAENGTATFYLSDSSDTSNSLATGFRESSSQIDVTVETLDSYVDRTGALPAIMKVDTETTEPDVLRGAARTITERRPWILCEVLAGRVEDRLTEVLKPFGYTWYHIDGEPPYQETDEIVGDRTYQSLMWLFAPEPPTAAFWAALRRIRSALDECTPQRGNDLADRRTRLAALGSDGMG